MVGAYFYFFFDFIKSWFFHSIGDWWNFRVCERVPMPISTPCPILTTMTSLVSASGKSARANRAISSASARMPKFRSLTPR